MAKDGTKAPRPRRTREHVIASQSCNYIEKFIIDKGHVAERQKEDYGYDLIVKTFDESGYEESGEIVIQLKASDNLVRLRHGDFVSLSIGVKHYELWISEPMPVFLILYDALERNAYWLYVQEYFTSDKHRRPGKRSKTLAIRIPLANTFVEDTVDYMRARKTAILAQIGGKVVHRG